MKSLKRWCMLVAVPIMVVASGCAWLQDVDTDALKAKLVELAKTKGAEAAIAKLDAAVESGMISESVRDALVAKIAELSKSGEVAAKSLPADVAAARAEGSRGL